jgi:hypothetical protein
MVGADCSQCVGPTLECLAYAGKRSLGCDAPLHEFRDRRDGDRSTFSRCAVGHPLQNGIADTRLDGIGTDGEIRIGNGLVTFHRLCRAFERRLAAFNRRGNAVQCDALCLPFRHLAFEQTHGNALAARARNGSIDALLSALPTLCKSGKHAGGQ